MQRYNKRKSCLSKKHYHHLQLFTEKLCICQWWNLIPDTCLLRFYHSHWINYKQELSIVLMVFPQWSEWFMPIRVNTNYTKPLIVFKYYSRFVWFKYIPDTCLLRFYHSHWINYKQELSIVLMVFPQWSEWFMPIRVNTNYTKPLIVFKYYSRFVWFKYIPDN